MIKKKLFRYASIFMCVTLIVANLSGCASSKSATDSTESATSADVSASSNSSILEDTLTAQIPASTSDTEKEETVYIFANADGSTDHMTVNEWLKNPQKISSLTDSTTLKDIKNVKGDETYTTNNDTISWNANGNDIVYQGTTSQQAPVDIKVTYYYEGNEISPDELAGKTGNVKIRFDYTNNSASKINVNNTTKDAFTPFTMITGLLLPTDHFYNIEATNGKVISESNSNIVLGITMPGLKESLGLDREDSELNIDMDIPEYFEVEAYAVDFELGMSMTVAMSSLLSTVNFDNVNLDDLKDDMNTLQDGSTQLVDGTSTLKDGTSELKDGVTTLADGTTTLKNGTTDLLDGTTTLKNGVTDYTNAVVTARDGSKELADGATTLDDGLSSLNEAFSKTDGLLDGVSSISSGAGQINNGVSKLKSVLTNSVGSMAQAKAGAEKNYADLLKSSNGSADGDIESDNELMIELIPYMMNFSGAVQAFLQSPTGQGVAASAGQQNAILYATQHDEDTQAAISDITNVLNAAGQKGAYTALSQILDQFSAKDPSTGLTLNQSLDTLATGANQLAVGAGTLKDKIGTFDDDENGTSLCSALYKIKNGSTDLKNGAVKLNDGLTEITNNNTELLDGVDKLQNGANDLNDGAAKLNDGADKLQNGVEQLDEGALTLKDGMVTLNNDGISKITSIVDGDAKNTVDTIKAVIDLGNNYQSFAGKNDSTKGTVKFIYKTAAITK